MPGAVTCHDIDRQRICDSDGCSFAIERCPAGSDGPTSCDPDSGECVPRADVVPSPMGCRPGVWVCVEGEVRRQCSDDGKRWIEQGDCDEDGLPRVCEMQGGQALCVPLCEADRKTRSYMGCEYWAVDLPQTAQTGPPRR